MASKTALDIINGAFRKLRVLAGEEAMTAAEAADALDNLNTMMHGFGPNGIYYAHVDLAALTDTVNMPDELIESLIYMFADEMAEDYGVERSPKLSRGIERAEQNLQAAYKNIRPAPSPRGMLRNLTGRFFDISRGE